MPRYCYSVWKDNMRVCTVERFFEAGEAPESVALDSGVEAVRDMGAEVTTQGLSADWNKPIHSHSAGFNVGQRVEAMAAAERDRIPLELDDRGAAIFRNRDQRRKVMRWRGLRDNDGGYSD